MAKIENIAVPKGSLLAEFGPPGAYRDCFIREVPGSVKLEQFVERFYCSAAFRPERIVLGLIGKGASNADARAVARGEVESFAAWSVVERRVAKTARRANRWRNTEAKSCSRIFAERQQAGWLSNPTDNQPSSCSAAGLASPIAGSSKR